jgi:hypothetical protein
MEQHGDEPVNMAQLLAAVRGVVKVLKSRIHAEQLRIDALEKRETP